MTWTISLLLEGFQSGNNLATQPVDKIRHDTLDTLSQVVMEFFARDCEVRLWKRDVSQAFRRVPIQAAHLEFAWTVWIHAGVLLISQHIGMPFGTVSAVYAWHRVGALLSRILRRYFKCPAARYVDDFFGSCRKGLKYHAGVVLSIVSRLLGFPTDAAKDADDAISMVCLGAQVQAFFSTRQLQTHVAPAKAAKYIRQLSQMLQTGVLAPGEAAKIAGRLGFSVTVSGNKVGRAFIKPFHAQSHAPLHGFSISPLLRRAGEWFVQYLHVCPTSVRTLPAGDCAKVVSWSDASGESQWIASVVNYRGRFWWTRSKTPPQVWTQLLNRSDCQIQFQELLGLLLTWGTFRQALSHNRWLAFVDNMSVLHAVTKGSGGGPEVHLCVGKLWLELATCQVDLHVGRVESKANVSDSPSRDDLSLMALLKATWVEPVFPTWVFELWEGPPAL